MLKLLLVEDSLADAVLAQGFLRAGWPDGGVAIEQVDNLQSALAALPGDFDAVITDLMLPESTPSDVVPQLAERANGPVIVLTGCDDIETAVRAIASGAADYLEKSSLKSGKLSKAVLSAIHRYRRKIVVQQASVSAAVEDLRTQCSTLVAEMQRLRESIRACDETAQEAAREVGT